MIGRRIYTAILLSAVWVLSVQKPTAASERPDVPLRYDRVQILEHFFRAMYPDIAQGLAMFEVDVLFEGTHDVTMRHIRFYPCLPMGVPNEAYKPVPLFPLRPAPSPPLESPVPPQCGFDPGPDFQNFLNIAVDVTSGLRKRPITRFVAAGTYVDAKLKEVQKQFDGKWYPTHDEVVDALRSKHPKYGPDNKKEFLARLPLDEIREWTGCRLNPETATFAAERQENNLHLPPELQWYISGRAAGSRKEGSCHAVFEPFDGHLTLFTD